MNKKAKYIYLYKYIENGQLIIILLNEIKYQCKPVFSFWAKTESPETLPTFNPIRILTPLLEVSAKIEFGGDIKKLLQHLNVEEANKVWPMFRHGLSHSIRPFYIQDGEKRYNWGISFSGRKHYRTNTDIVISPLKLLEDLEKYLNSIKYKTGKTKIQDGIKLNP